MAESQPPRVLVSGASGFLATHIVQKLLQGEAFQVRGSVRNVNNDAKTAPLRNLCPEAKYPLELVQADLLDADSWISAVKDCDYVIHVASPFVTNVKTEDEVVKPAVEGTRNVLEACAKSGCVKRVVLTSSLVAIYVGDHDANYILTEKDWSVVEDCQPYEKSKVMAERSAWEFIENLPDEQKFDLATINPGYILGPVLHGSKCTSMEIHTRLLQREMPLLPRMHIPICDVRDVATAHIKALTLPEAAGNRHIIWSASLWMKEYAQVLQKEFGSQGYSIPTTYCPKVGLQIISFFDKSVKDLLPYIGKVINVSNERMVKTLEITPIEVEKSIIEMAYSLIDAGFVKKTDAYKGNTASTSKE